jgi:hypothetical protein
MKKAYKQSTKNPGWKTLRKANKRRTANDSYLDRNMTRKIGRGKGR